MVFKCLNGLASTYLSSKLAKRSSCNKYITRHASDIHLPLNKSTSAQRSFFYRAAKEWNSLTENAKLCKSVATLKEEVGKDHKNLSLLSLFTVVIVKCVNIIISFLG